MTNATFTHGDARRLVRKAIHAPSRIREAPMGLGRFFRSLVVDPVETLLYVPDAVSSQLFDKRVIYEVKEDWAPPFHRMLGAPWPCSEFEQFPQIWADIESRLSAKGLPIGRWTYGQYSDADAALSAASWCAVRHLRPAKVLETGVARGVTSRVILEAMSINSSGHLWSLDLPHPFRPELHTQTAEAVPSTCRARWTWFEPPSAPISYLQSGRDRHVRPRQPAYRSQHAI